MSYCRHNGVDSEAYVIATISGWLECMGCRITGDPASNGLRYGNYSTQSRTEMLKHLQEHRQRGWKVPFRASRRLKREIREQGDRTRRE